MKKDSIVTFFKIESSLHGSDFFNVLSTFHKKKFPNVDADTQYKKLLGEVHEFECAVSEEEKIDEACDIIISAIGYLDRVSDAKLEVYEKFLKVLERNYPDQFQHKEGGENGKQK